MNETDENIIGSKDQLDLSLEEIKETEEFSDEQLQESKLLAKVKYYMHAFQYFCFHLTLFAVSYV